MANAPQTDRVLTLSSVLILAPAHCTKAKSCGAQKKKAELVLRRINSTEINEALEKSLRQARNWRLPQKSQGWQRRENSKGTTTALTAWGAMHGACHLPLTAVLPLQTLCTDCPSLKLEEHQKFPHLVRL